MNCEQMRDYLAAYLDGELDVASTIGLERHLGECPHCRLARESALSLHTAIKRADLYELPSPELGAKVQAAVRRAAQAETRADRRTHFAFRWWVPAAALLAAVVIWFSLTRPPFSHEQLIAQEVVSSHIRSLQPGHLVDVPSSDRHTVKPWFQGKLNFSPPVPDLAQQGWVLTGGRLDYVNGRPVAALIYERRRHNINLFIWPGPTDRAGPMDDQEIQGYRAVHWNSAGMTYWSVSDLNRAELLEFAKAVSGRP